MPTNKNLSSLVINKVESETVYNQMKAQNLINEDELYLVNDTGGVAAHNQSADTITAGTFASESVYAKSGTDYWNTRIRNILLEQDYGMGAPLAVMSNGDIALMYE